MGAPVGIDPAERLAERARISHFGRRGDVSCGGATHLLRSADDWMAVSLARPDDWELVSAWFGLDDDAVHGDWDRVAAEVARRPAAEVAERAHLLGLPVSTLGERAAPRSGAPFGPVRASRVGDAAPIADLADVMVVDLSSLWAGPLAAGLLQRCGARVDKVESTARPDGARRGPREFFDLLNGGKRAAMLDFGTDDGRRSLRDLVQGADVVVTSARRRAIDQLGLDLERVIAEGHPRIWLSITGYGVTRRGVGLTDVDRVAFGDDAAVAGGLVAWDADGPCFVADAVADPCTGIAGAAAVLSALQLGGRWVLDAAMADVAAHLAAG